MRSWSDVYPDLLRMSKWDWVGWREALAEALDIDPSRAWQLGEAPALHSACLRALYSNVRMRPTCGPAHSVCEALGLGPNAAAYMLAFCLRTRSRYVLDGAPRPFLPKLPEPNPHPPLFGETQLRAVADVAPGIAQSVLDAAKETMHRKRPLRFVFVHGSEVDVDRLAQVTSNITHAHLVVRVEQAPDHSVYEDAVQIKMLFKPNTRHA